jgi:hypothetical protein
LDAFTYALTRYDQLEESKKQAADSIKEQRQAG